MPIRPYTIDFHDQVMALMHATPGMSIREADSRDATARYLARNPGLNFLALDEAGRVIGCAMCGHDGRRGYLQHVVVEAAHRRQGIARRLVRQCLDGLVAAGIEKAHLEVFVDNRLARHYWPSQGWHRRDDTCRYSMPLTGNPDA